MECVELRDVVHNGMVYKVPCGKCAFCGVNNISQWMFRLYWENRRQEDPGWFLTLTYDESHVPRMRDGDLSLRFGDVQKYLKMLRKAGYRAKYVCVGEYGGERHRPHYHMLIWSDCPAVDLELKWKFGRVHFGAVSMDSIGYTLKYVINQRKRKGGSVEKTRAQFSKGLGLGYLTCAVYDYHTMDYENPVMKSYIDGREVVLPRYYRRKIFTRYQQRREAHRIKWERIREKRKEMRALLAKGIRGVAEYRKGLRIDLAARIVRTAEKGLKVGN